MNDYKTIQKDLTSVKLTKEFASAIGCRAKGGEIIELISDLGGGKTTFVKGLVQGAGSNDVVTSPSFSLRNDYRAPRFNIAHFDFYRLEDPGLLSEMIAEIVSDDNILLIIEWAQVVTHVLPDDRIRITLKVAGEEKRTILVEYPQDREYLFLEN